MTCVVAKPARNVAAVASAMAALPPATPQPPTPPEVPPTTPPDLPPDAPDENPSPTPPETPPAQPPNEFRRRLAAIGATTTQDERPRCTTELPWKAELGAAGLPPTRPWP